MKSKIKATVSAILAASLIFSLCSCDNKKTPETTPDTAVKQEDKINQQQINYDKKAESYKKNETVYINMDPDGTVTNKTVTDWLHTDTAETYINDISNLENITNVKSSIQPVNTKDGFLKWNMETTDLYYRGTTQKELPVNFSIDYYLNGKKSTAEDVAGKSGQVKMVINAENQSSKEVTIDGKKCIIYTPFIVAGGMIFDETVFSNITVENGKSIGDGTKEIALLIGVPGLKESLNLSDEILKELGDFDFTSNFTITVDTQCFELSNMIFAALPLSSIYTEMNDSLPVSVDDIKQKLSVIQTIIDKLNTMNVQEITGFLFSDPKKLTELASSVEKLSTVYNTNKPLIEVLEKYMTEENMNAIKALLDDTKKTDLDKVYRLLNDPVLLAFIKDLPQISKDVNAVKPVLDGLSEDLKDPQVNKAIDELPQTLETLKELKALVDDNQELLTSLSNTFDEKNINELNSLISSLSTVTNEETLKKYSSLLGNADGLIARAKEWIKAGTEYKIFTEAEENAETSVMFVYETSPIKAKKKKSEETTISTLTDKKESKGLKGFIDKVFKK